MVEVVKFIEALRQKWIQSFGDDDNLTILSGPLNMYGVEVPDWIEIRCGCRIIKFPVVTISWVPQHKQEKLVLGLSNPERVVGEHQFPLDTPPEKLVETIWHDFTLAIHEIAGYHKLMFATSQCPHCLKSPATFYRVRTL